MRRLHWTFIGATAAILLTAASLRLLGALNARLVRVQQEFRPAPKFALFDSLPALSPGLSSLEAFSVTLPPGTLANADRSLWIAKTLDTVRFAFHSDRDPFDSAHLFLWAGDKTHRENARRRGGFDWFVPVKRRVSGWSEVVAVYASFPPRIRIRARDPSVAVFERVEGTVLHVVADAYARLPETAAAPDTTYPAANAGAGETLLLARGKTLAVVNPGRRALRLRILRVEEARGRREPGSRNGSLHVVPAGTVHVYRGLLERQATTLAYTGAGEPICMLGKCGVVEREFFRLAPGGE